MICTNQSLLRLAVSGAVIYQLNWFNLLDASSVALVRIKVWGGKQSS